MKRAAMVLLILMCAAALLALPPDGVGAEKGLIAKIVAAKSAADQEEIAAELEQEARDLEAKAALHAEMAKHYDTEQYAQERKPSLRTHCEELSASLRKAAELSREMAKVHRELARNVGK